jgi:N-acetylmuramoyl-L-alanine amidase/putative methionine-R-sulfoxide reductase with GAF domain
MVTMPNKPGADDGARGGRAQASPWPHESAGASSSVSHKDESRPSGSDALQALLAFSAMHQQVRKRRALALRQNGFETIPAAAEFDPPEQFVLDEVLQLVAERAIAITGADGLGIALAENDEIVLRVSAGTVKPDVGQRIQRNSAFSGACFRTAQIIRCDDTETDDRVNLYACRQLGARSMVAVPLCGRKRVIGLLEAFSVEPFGFNDSDMASLELLAELVVAALKPEDEDRFAQAAQVAQKKLEDPTSAPQAVRIPEPTSKILPAAPAPSASPAPSATPTLSATHAPSATPALPAAPAPSATRTSFATPAPAAQPPRVGTRPTTLASLSAESKVENDRRPLSTLTSEPVESVPSAHHPGIRLVLAFVAIAAVLGGGLWWKLKNAAISPVEKTVSSTPPSASRRSPSPAPSAPARASSPSSSPSVAPNAPSNVQSNSSGAAAASSQSLSANDQTLAPEEAGKMARITGIRHWSSADSSTVVLDLEDQVQYEAHRLTNPDRIYFDLHDTSLAPELEGKSIEIGDALLGKIRIAQPISGLTRLVLETRGDSNYSVSLEPNPYRLVVQVTKLGAPKAQINLFPGTGEPNKLAIVVPPPSKEDMQLRARVPRLRIVVDAGHGGWDLGTVGRRGLLEKDLVLEIAQRLGKLLESRLGADVILTRNDDTYIPLDERAEIANHAQADLFISVHANYSDLPSARGVETYYTNVFSSPNAKDLETRAGGGGNLAATARLTPAELHDKIEQSRRLAASVQRSLYGVLAVENPGLRDRGVKEASYVVLTETAMAGILAEVSFVSSPTDEQKLRSDGYREEIAEALYKGVARYAANLHSVKLASAGK